MNRKSNLLKYALFATGLSGIVAEYILSTLATYFLGDSVIQWTLIVSMMLFAMGLGSRISKYIDNYLLEKFIFTEFLLSILASFSTIFVYYIASFSEAKAFFIYLLATLIGLMIGLEIPLVTRMNDAYEELKINIAMVLEKDYYGSLIGGLFFAFVGLPYLGLTYTPFVLGGINFLVAVLLMFKLKGLIAKKRISLYIIAAITGTMLLLGGIFAKPIIMFSEQVKYKDKIVFEEQSKYQRIVITKWHEDYWLYINGNLQFSSFDEFMYHEPLVHPAMMLVPNPKKVLVLGGGDGCAIREVLKHESIESVVLVDLDPSMTNIAIQNEFFSTLNNHSLNNKKVKIINQDAYIYVQNSKEFFDLIIVDLPDPKSVDLGRLYSTEFYHNCASILSGAGIFVTQATSPYFSGKAYFCIDKTLKSAGFETVKLHNQILTMGEWGFIIGSKRLSTKEMHKLLSEKELTVNTKWLNKDGIQLIKSFGKSVFVNDTSIVANTLINPVLPKYYSEGVWSLF